MYTDLHLKHFKKHSFLSQINKQIKELRAQTVKSATQGKRFNHKISTQYTTWSENGLHTILLHRSEYPPISVNHLYVSE